MASWTSPVTHVSGDVLSVTDWNGVANNETFLYQVPYILAYNSVSTSLTDGTPTQISLGGITADGYGFSVSSNNVIVPLTGVYSVQFAVQVGGSGSPGANDMNCSVYHNGSVVIQGSTVPTATTFPGSSGGGLVACSASDTLGLVAVQGASATLSTQNNAYSTFLHVFFVGSQ
jgi:hypothetical protein